MQINNPAVRVVLGEERTPQKIQWKGMNNCLPFRDKPPKPPEVRLEHHSCIRIMFFFSNMICNSVLGTKRTDPKSADNPELCISVVRADVIPLVLFFNLVHEEHKNLGLGTVLKTSNKDDEYVTRTRLLH